MTSVASELSQEQKPAILSFSFGRFVAPAGTSVCTRPILGQECYVITKPDGTESKATVRSIERNTRLFEQVLSDGGFQRAYN